MKFKVKCKMMDKKKKLFKIQKKYKLQDQKLMNNIEINICHNKQNIQLIFLIIILNMKIKNNIKIIMLNQFVKFFKDFNLN